MSLSSRKVSNSCDVSIISCNVLSSSNLIIFRLTFSPSGLVTSDVFLFPFVFLVWGSNLLLLFHFSLHDLPFLYCYYCTFDFRSYFLFGIYYYFCDHFVSYFCLWHLIFYLCLTFRALFISFYLLVYVVDLCLLIFVWATLIFGDNYYYLFFVVFLTVSS